ncbi:MAG TPA: RDD family protein [Gaiellaceae bacterium]|nr:RDD family protein [Gaiellaceae bacterium]
MDDAGALVGQAAGFWRRFAAAFIDGVALAVIDYILRLILGGAGQVIGILVSLAYFTYFHGRTGQTPGDAALGIRVVDVRDNPGETIGYGRAALRWLVSIVSTIVVFLGFLWMLWDSEKQTWHDKAAGSLPVYRG